MNIVQLLNYRLRAGHRSDAKRVLEIFYGALREHGFAAIPENVNAEISNFGLGTDPRFDELVALSCGKVCGFLILAPTDRASCGELLKIFVAPSHRGQGVATMLIDECVRRATERGYRELILETHTAFATGRRYYENHG